MVKYLASLLAIAAFTSAFAAPQLEGEWRSDGERTMAFIEANARLEPKTLDFYRSITGRLRLTFTEASVHSVLPDHHVIISGQEHHMVGFDEAHPYSVLREYSNVIVIETVAPVTGTTEVVVFNFDGPDVMWVYSGGADKAFPESHLREYFVRRRDGD